jgi:hypothetical protein
MSDRPRRKTTRRDLPALVLIFGVIFAAAALCGPFPSVSFLPKENDLRTISGLVQRAPYITGPERGATSSKSLFVEAMVYTISLRTIWVIWFLELWTRS